MKAMQIVGSFGLDAVKETELPDPTPGAGQVLIRVRAASLNFRDLMMVRGVYNPKLALPQTICSDGAGEVAAIGPGVTRVCVGDRVAGAFTQEWIAGEFKAIYWQRSTLGGPLPGMLAEYNVLDEAGVVKIPEHLSYEEASTLPCAAVTAWHALVTSGKLRAGQSVLILGTGGVALFALQFAKMHGARVIITSSSDEKLARAKRLGADELINYQSTPDWERQVLALTDNLGVDHVVELGGPGTLAKSLTSVKAGGRVHVIGVLTGVGSTVDPMPVLFKAVQVGGILVGSREMFEHMNEAVTFQKLKPVIDRVFDFGDARKALDHMTSASHFGKIVITV